MIIPLWNASFTLAKEFDALPKLLYAPTRAQLRLMRAIISGSLQIKLGRLERREGEHEVDVTPYRFFIGGKRVNEEVAHSSVREGFAKWDRSTDSTLKVTDYGMQFI